MAGYHTNVGAKRARQYRAELGLAPDEPLECLLTVVEQRAGIPVAVVEIADGFAGAYLRRGAVGRRSSCTRPTGRRASASVSRMSSAITGSAMSR